MANTITGDQVVEAAKELSQEEFTRADVAEKLGDVPPPKTVKKAKKARVVSRKKRAKS